MKEHHILLILLLIFTSLMFLLVEPPNYYDPVNFEGPEIIFPTVLCSEIMTVTNVYVDVNGIVREL